MLECGYIAAVVIKSAVPGGQAATAGVQVGAALKAVGADPVTPGMSFDDILQKVGEAKQKSAKFSITFGPAGPIP